MREKTFHVYVDSHDRSLLLQSLVELKNLLIQQGRYTDCVDELIFKVSKLAEHPYRKRLLPVWVRRTAGRSKRSVRALPLIAAAATASSRFASSRVLGKIAGGCTPARCQQQP